MIAVLFAVGGAVGCASEPEARAPEPRRRTAPVVFVYGTPNGEELGSDQMRGRVTAILFVTTYDLPSQVMARRLDEVVRGHRPRVNAAAIALEAPDAAPLVDVFRTTLGLGYPVGLAMTPGVQHEGPFGVIDRVPTLVVLDRDGREVARRSGNLTNEEIEEALRSAETP